MQGEEYEILDDSREHWWRAKDKDGYVYGWWIWRLIVVFMNPHLRDCALLIKNNRNKYIHVENWIPLFAIVGDLVIYHQTTSKRNLI